jgi:predicted solute-binding protein
VPFDEIEEFVLQGKADAGLLIHEGSSPMPTTA